MHELTKSGSIFKVLTKGYHLWLKIALLRPLRGTSSITLVPKLKQLVTHPISEYSVIYWPPFLPTSPTNPFKKDVGSLSCCVRTDHAAQKSLSRPGHSQTAGCLTPLTFYLSARSLRTWGWKPLIHHKGMAGSRWNSLRRHTHVSFHYKRVLPNVFRLGA